MFEELFEIPDTIERYRAAPLAEPRELYLRHLADFGAGRLTLRQIALDQIRLLDVLDLHEGEKVSVAEIEATEPDWAHARRPRLGRSLPTTRKSAKRSLSRVIRWLRFLGWLDEPEENRHPYSAELGAFEEWMRAERGYAEQTIDGNLRSAREFLDWLAAGGKQLKSARIADVDAAIKAKTARRHYSRVTIRSGAGRLRVFFRFAEEHDLCTPGMAEGIVPPRFYRDQKVRGTLSRSDIERLLATTDSDRPKDKRDRAILMLLIVYGLRAGEIRTLRLDDLDWENETLRVHRPKTGRTDLFPLSQAVGQAIVRYLVDVRPPRPERALFLTLAAPIRPLGRTTPGYMVRRRMDEAGIAAERRGTHVLRHTAAQHLLDRGVSMKVIGDYLGHRNPRSTKAYARFDLNALREVADFDLEGLA
ncbi:MAG: tyrosine-type recombinase/integrase [Proteobacteria bacterium]|nr:tyrosine-type recombinase/integrase [Pseudomonadota bacterium]